ncbi:MAG: GTPase HflX [Candidatus Dormibacteraeota bacterium]|uniref:GTPase HflX n=1 Tax=Candidatus Aeolococcus gillhamiae TaxID=3127015 RepID=A0A934K469_9BACT|nr:GTPase HflX [Candidatus Dormibacteraeota bacterium]
MARQRGAASAPVLGTALTRVLIAGSFQRSSRREQTEIELDELEELARTLGTTVVERAAVPLREVHPGTFFGSGTVEALGARIEELRSPAALVNDQLSPRQQRNLQETWGVPVLDRTDVILAIFGRRARSAEGRVQVEMAQLAHQLSRLAGGWAHLERQRGRVGTGGMRGGMGEKQIEVDRRLINQKLRRLRQRLKEIQRQRTTRRTARTAVPLASCALVGYTNAGKSTLLNQLTNSTVLADNLLFATLDPTSRLLGLSSGRRVIVTDTVGFIQSLPHELVEAFSATLEEVREAHLLTIVVDASHPDAEAQLQTVLETLDEMGCDQPAILAVNKVDRLDSAEAKEVAQRLGAVAGMEPLLISAAKATGLRELRHAIDELVAQVVPDTRANRPIIASHAVEEPAPELDEPPVRASRRAAF